MYSQEEIIRAHGPYKSVQQADPAFIRDCIKEIQGFPSVLETFVSQLKPEHYDVSYRDGGWTFRQVIHHLADSHMQAYTRFKLALTEEKPTIKPYIQDLWAGTKDSTSTNPGISVQLLKALHARWCVLLESLTSADFEKSYIHPEYNREYKLFDVLGLYAWHGKHHYTQLERYASNQAWIQNGNLK